MRADDAEDVIKERLAVYQSQTAPLIRWYDKRGLLGRIDGDGDVAEVGTRLREQLED